jgi:uncharacterized protein
MGRIFRLALCVLAILALPLAGTAAAQEDLSGTSYMTPFPEGDIYKLQIYGDAYADGLLAGLSESFTRDSRVAILHKPRALSGLGRPEFDDEIRSEETQPREVVHIGVIMIGAGDRFALRLATGRRLAFGSEEWREEYGRRVDRLIKALKRQKIALYWIGLPIMRRSDANDDAQMINDIVREKAYLNGIKFIDIRAQFADEAGNYSAYGPDLTGKNRLLRESDGVLFTSAGDRKLAHFVEQEIKRDLIEARNQRAIPLAGNEGEQMRVSAQRPKSTPESDGAWKGTVNAVKEAKAGRQTNTTPGFTQPAQGQAGDSSSEPRADNGRITLKSVAAGGREEAVTLDLPRPAIPSAVIALITRKESSDRPSQMGDVVADEVGGGLVVLSSITAASGSGGSTRRTAPSQSPYYQVFIKGERLAAKPGRADDFTWPRTEPDLGNAPTLPARRTLRAPRS